LTDGSCHLRAWLAAVRPPGLAADGSAARGKPIDCGWRICAALRVLVVRALSPRLNVGTDVETSSSASVYVTAVAWVFMLTNSLRVLTYLPMIRRLLRPGIAAECQSQLTWLLWATANLSMSLHLFELAGRELNDAVFLTGANTLMCCVCWYLVRRAQRRAWRAPTPADASPEPSTLGGAQRNPGFALIAEESRDARPRDRPRPLVAHGAQSAAAAGAPLSGIGIGVHE
jgi:hypothetical protein